MESQNVLVVEDDAVVRELVVTVLADAGYRPVAIADHSLITETVQRWHPRCVILDGELLPTGESRSWRDAAAIRRANPALPVVLFTGDAVAVAEARSRQSYRSRAAGFAGIIGKPFAIDDLLATVKAVVDGSHETDPVGMIVHELRQPLTIIRGRVQLARRYLASDPVRGGKAMDETLTQVDRMDDLIGQLLDHAYLASEGFSLNVALLDLVETLAQVVAAHEDGATGRIRFERPAGAVPVYADRVRIAQIVDNLLSNALKYSAVGTAITVSLTTDGVEAQIRVSDQGVGVPDEERALVFTAFYRTSRSRGIGGTGLGLHISRKLAERHGGRLWLDATSSAGSVFALALPIARGDPLSGARRS